MSSGNSNSTSNQMWGGRFAAGIARGNLAGVQFHPEKSHRYGKRLLANFAGVTV